VTEHNNPDSLDARLFPCVILAVAPAVNMDEASVHIVAFWAATTGAAAGGEGGEGGGGRCWRGHATYIYTYKYIL